MPCVKTGCHIYIIPYGVFAYGDAHKVDEVYFFRLAQASHKPLHDVLHFELNNYDSWWDAKSTKEFRPPVSTLAASGSDVISWGYEGRDINLFPFAKDL